MKSILQLTILLVAAGTFAAAPQLAVAQVVEKLPFVSQSDKDRLRDRYMRVKLQKAIAITEAGGWGYSTGKDTIEAARQGALEACEKDNRQYPCIIAAENDELVFETRYDRDELEARALRMIKSTGLFQAAYYDEDKLTGVAPQNTRQTGAVHAPTPITVPGAKTITTRQLVDLMYTEKAALVNVLDWREGAFAIPGTRWVQGLGTGRPLTPQLKESVERALYDVQSDRDKPIVFYCVSWECWLSYNASLMALELGYRNVYWYRGGYAAWKEAGLPLVKSRLFRKI